ncbi:hypothetical protein BG006_008299 [Podila minutissima]|uniref:Gamma-soluble NSF attachment protein n=1 Tax=Podila minutissima TaxID=64525 RepID=A0A9P5SGN3_9FUNG|nr:hypothetical protein BG006_008299 [Podila minutissima]
MALEEARLKDAIKYMQEADKNTVKSFFKKPDWDIATQYYEKAAQSFKAAKSYEQSVQAFVKTSEAMINATSLFMAGRALENGGNIALQNLGQPERAADMYKRASELFMQNMTPDRAAEMLEKSAKAMEPISVDAAIDLYIGACSIYENEDRAKYATDTYKRTIGLLVKHKRYEKAVETLQRLGNVQKETINKSAYYKTLLSIIIIQLAAGDEVDAGKRFQSFCMVEGFVRSEESAVAHAMLDAFEHRDQNYYNQTAARQHVGFLDNEIARLARNIVISNDLISGGGGAGGFNGQQQFQGGQFNDHNDQHQNFQPQQQHFQPQQVQQPYQQGPPPGQNDFYQSGPDPRYIQPPQRPSSNGPPPHVRPLSGEREEADWRALTQNPATTRTPPPHQNQGQYQHSPAPPQQQHQPHQGAPPSRNYYDDDGDDSLL